MGRYSKIQIHASICHPSLQQVGVCLAVVGFRGLSGGPVVKTPPLSAGGGGSIPGQAVRSHMSLGQKKNKTKRNGQPKHKGEAMF